ncbi:hypothetical protein [Robertmurraya sp. Marseille-Q9965]
MDIPNSEIIDVSLDDTYGGEEKTVLELAHTVWNDG